VLADIGIVLAAFIVTSAVATLLGAANLVVRSARLRRRPGLRAAQALTPHRT
jgi:hypothetical protein